MPSSSTTGRTPRGLSSTTLAIPSSFHTGSACATARREFFLYNGYSLVTFGLLFSSLVYQFEVGFPELSVKDFLPIALGTLTVQLATISLFLMPIATTVVHYHLLKSPRRLFALL